jgi:ADP-ribosylglycohydrolase
LSAAGTLWGLAYGDVLGAPIESWSETDIATVFGAYSSPPAPYPVAVPLSKRARLRPPGLHTDDTQQALALIAVCLSGYSNLAWSRCLVDGARAKAWRGTGRRFDAAVEKLHKGAPPEKSGSPSAGIGAAMRVGVLGALYRDQSRKLAEISLESSAVTHADLRSIALAYAVAFASAQLVNGKSAADVRLTLADAVCEAEDEWLMGRTSWSVDRAGRHQLSLCLARVLAAAPAGGDVKAIGALVLKTAAPYMDPKAMGSPAHQNHAFALLGGLQALACALVDDADPVATLTAIVRMGADTDTVAAIAGSLLGARFGDGWVPKDQIADRDRIARFATALEVRGAAPESVAQLVSAEAALTAQEAAFQANPAWPK